MKNKTRRRTSAILGLILIFYVVHQIYQVNQGTVETEIASYATVSETVETRGFAIRDEIVVNLPVKGAVDYSVSDGDRVSRDDPIVNVYPSKFSASARNQINRLQKELDSLESLNNYSANPGAVNEHIYEYLNEILTDVNQYRFDELQSVREEFQTAVNHKNLVVGKETVADYLPRIQEIKSQLAVLESQISEPTSVIGAPQAGYFISRVDGYENIIDVEETKGLVPSQINELLHTKVETTKSDASVGKICRSFNWYIAAVLTESEAVGLEGIEKVKLEIPFATTQQIPATVVARNVDPVTKEVAVIFSCLNMDADIAKIRNESIQIILRTYSGVLVNEDSIVFEDCAYDIVDENGVRQQGVKKNVKGVYVLNGDTVEFVQIVTNKTINGYAICRVDLSDKERDALYTKNFLKQYDNVVSRMDGLFDGKVV